MICCAKLLFLLFFANASSDNAKGAKTNASAITIADEASNVLYTCVHTCKLYSKNLIYIRYFKKLYEYV